jgi:hypothetical protein
MKQVRDDLQRAGLKVWTDEGIEVGTVSWKESIETAIRNSETMVVLMSPASNDSTWVQREIDYADVQDVRILPLLIEGTPERSVPFALVGAQYVDVRSDYDDGIQKLIRRLKRHLNRNSSVTLEAKGRQDETVQAKGRRKKQADHTLKIGAALVFLVLFIGSGIFFGVFNNTPENVIASTTPAAASSSQSQPVLLRYHADSLVLQNQTSERINIRDLVFRLESEDGSRTEFRSNEWGGNLWALPPGDCVQAWDLSDRRLRSSDRPPADTCESRQRYRATYHTFWRSSSDDAVFRIFHADELLASCPTAPPESDEILECGVPLPADST